MVSSTQKPKNKGTLGNILESFYYAVVWFRSVKLVENGSDDSIVTACYSIEVELGFYVYERGLIYWYMQSKPIGICG